ncbi:MAG: OmpA family protein [Cloacibacillus sp.]
MRKRIYKHVSGSDEDCFTISISDLMAGLLSIFILVLIAFALNFKAHNDKLISNQEIRTQMLERIDRELKGQNILSIEVKKDIGVINFPSTSLFTKGNDKLSPQGQTLIKKFTIILYKVLNDENYKGKVETVFIEGHTDGDNYATQLERIGRDNWWLSTQRAIATWKLMKATKKEVESELKNSSGQPLFSCSGYADTRPLAVETQGGKQVQEAAKERNRRIAFRITMMPPKAEVFSTENPDIKNQEDK